MSIHEGWLPPTLNLDNLDVSHDNDDNEQCVESLNFVTSGGQQWDVEDNRRVALSNSFGFGGTNASLCFAQFVE